MRDSYVGHNLRRIDSKTIEPQLEQIKSDQLPLPMEVIYDRGVCGIKKACGFKVTIPNYAKDSDSAANKSRMRSGFRRMAGIKPHIGQLKT